MNRLRSSLSRWSLLLAALWGAVWLLLLFVMPASESSDFAGFYIAARVAASDGPAGMLRLADPQFFSQQQALLTPGYAGTGTTFIYPPHFAALLQPLAHWSYPAAFLIWRAALLIVMALAWWLASPLSSWRDRFSHWLAIVGFAPMLLSLILGQSTPLFAGICLAATALYDRQRPFAAGLLFGLAAFKPQLIVALPLFLLLRRAWPALAGFGLTLLLHVVAALWTFGPAAAVVWLSSITSTNQLASVVGSAGFYLVSPVSWMPWLSAADMRWLAVGWSACMAIACALWVRATRARSAGQLLPLLPLWSLLLAPYVHFYDLALLVVTGWSFMRLSGSQAAWSRVQVWYWLPLPVLALILVFRLPLGILFLGALSAAGFSPRWWTLVCRVARGLVPRPRPSHGADTASRERWPVLTRPVTWTQPRAFDESV
jgi:hypothetical protein